MDQFYTARLLQEIIDYAVVCNATDIHLMLKGQKMSVAYRIAGHVRPFVDVQDRGDELFRRLKAIARMDVTIRLMPQEGTFTWDVSNRSVRIRVSSIPLYDGESMVLRILLANHHIPSLQSLGFTSMQLAQVRELCCRHSGLGVVSGRTGVGKTTTLYAFMEHLAVQGRQVFSIEDPVEISVTHCRQVEVHTQQGFTYDVALRALLRQDPDVLIIGEIRDEETAQMAYRAALTGRLVFATVHADGMRGVFARFEDLGVRRALLADVLHTVITQTDDGRDQSHTLRRFKVETNHSGYSDKQLGLNRLGDSGDSNTMAAM